MNWLAIVAALAQGLSWFINYLRNQQALSEAEALVLGQQAREMLDEIQKAQAARATVRDRIAVDPNSVRKPSADDRPWDAGS